MLSDLHTRRQKADWEYIPKQERTMIQRIAAATHGVITPANLVSVSGFFLVIWGLMLIVRDGEALGLACIVIGRLADIADGYIANRTKTKSHLGEILDVVIDKLTVAITLVALIIYFTIPSFALAFVILHTVLSTAAGIYVHAKSYDIHTTRLGKYATAMTWLVIILFILLALEPNVFLSGITFGVFGAYIAIAIASLHEYLTKISSAKRIS